MSNCVSLIEIVAKHEFRMRELLELGSEEKINYTIEHRSHTKLKDSNSFSLCFLLRRRRLSSPSTLYGTFVINKFQSSKNV